MDRLIPCLLAAWLAVPTFAQTTDGQPVPPEVTPTAAASAKTGELRDRFFLSLGFPLVFSYNTYPALDPILNNGWTSRVPNTAWANGLAIDVGFEKPLDPRFALLLEMSLMNMEIDQLQVENMDFPPRKTGATLFTGILGLKVAVNPENPVQPYFVGGLGFSSVHISELLIHWNADWVPGYEGVRLTVRAAAGLDIRCDDEMTAFVEFQFDDLDTLNLLAPGPDLSTGLFKSGLRLAM
jgi:opacity protein-like surface antigen